LVTTNGSWMPRHFATPDQERNGWMESSEGAFAIAKRRDGERRRSLMHRVGAVQESARLLCDLAVGEQYGAGLYTDLGGQGHGFCWASRAGYFAENPFEPFIHGRHAYWAWACRCVSNSHGWTPRKSLGLTGEERDHPAFSTPSKPTCQEVPCTITHAERVIGQAIDCQVPLGLAIEIEIHRTRGGGSAIDVLRNLSGNRPDHRPRGRRCDPRKTPQFSALRRRVIRLCL